MNIEELTEKIVIIYANLSGRETANRAEFRERIKSLLEQQKKEILEKTEDQEGADILSKKEHREITMGCFDRDELRENYRKVLQFLALKDKE